MGRWGAGCGGLSRSERESSTMTGRSSNGGPRYGWRKAYDVEVVDKELGDGEYRLLQLLKRLEAMRKGCIASAWWMGWALGIHPREVKKRLRRLQDLGLVWRGKEPGQHTYRTLVVPVEEAYKGAQMATLTVPVRPPLTVPGRPRRGEREGRGDRGRVEGAPLPTLPPAGDGSPCTPSRAAGAAEDDGHPTPSGPAARHGRDDVQDASRRKPAAVSAPPMASQEELQRKAKDVDERKRAPTG